MSMEKSMCLVLIDGDWLWFSRTMNFMRGDIRGIGIGELVQPNSVWAVGLGALNYC